MKPTSVDPTKKRFQPFPTDALPEPLRAFVVKGAAAIGCDPSLIALPLLTAVGAAIGNKRRLQLKPDWTAPPILWTVIVGESGVSKSPALRLALKFVHKRQAKAAKQQEDAINQYKDDQAVYEESFAKWKQGKGEGNPPTELKKPVVERICVGDITVEALATLLLENPNGLLYAQDEVSGWFGSFGRYSNGKGADVAHWLSMFNGDSLMVDRKTGEPRSIHVPQASVSVTGGIQPKILHRALGLEHRESGLAARLLMTYPPRKHKKWTEAVVDPFLEEHVEQMFDHLYEMESGTDELGLPAAITVSLSADAKATFVEFYDAHAEQLLGLHGDLAAAWSKLEQYAARLALVIHYSRWAAGDQTLEGPDVVDARSMKSGIQLVEWFKHETERIYSIFAEAEDDGKARELCEWIEAKGGSVTVRVVQQGRREFSTAEETESALNKLVKAGWGEWHEKPSSAQGGRPTWEFRLFPNSASTEPTNTPHSGGCVDVDSVDTPSEHDEWGEL